MKASGIISSLAMLCLSCAMVFGGGAGFFNIPILAIVIALPLFMSLASFGFADTASGLRSMALVVTDSVSISNPVRIARVLCSITRQVYASAALATAFALCTMLRDLDDPGIIHQVLFLCVLSFLYAILLAECFVRPTLRQVENLVEKEK